MLAMNMRMPYSGGEVMLTNTRPITLYNCESISIRKANESWLFASTLDLSIICNLCSPHISSSTVWPNQDCILYNIHYTYIYICYIYSKYMAMLLIILSNQLRDRVAEITCTFNTQLYIWCRHKHRNKNTAPHTPHASYYVLYIAICICESSSYIRDRVRSSSSHCSEWIGYIGKDYLRHFACEIVSCTATKSLCGWYWPTIYK